MRLFMVSICRLAIKLNQFSNKKYYYNRYFFTSDRITIINIFMLTSKLRDQHPSYIIETQK